MRDAGDDAAADRPATGAALHGPVPAWVWGGVLLVVSAVVPQVLYAGVDAPGRSVLYWFGMVAFSAALLLFAYGWPMPRGRGAVAAGQPSGTVALTVLALWPLASAIVASIVPASVDDYTFLTIWSYVDRVVWLGAAIVAVVAIRRAGVVPAPWHRAPTWALAAVAGVWVLAQLLAVSMGQSAIETLMLLFQLSGMVMFLAPLGLGILAIVLGLRADPRPAVPIYRSSPTGPAAGG